MTNIDTKPKRRKGRKAGSRNNFEAAEALKQGANKGNADPRHGSKRPVALVVDPKPSQKPKFKTPQQELDHIENDKRLQQILDKMDKGDTVKVSRSEQEYAEQRLERHKVLCELMGIDEPEEMELGSDEPDLLQQLDANHLNNYR